MAQSIGVQGIGLAPAQPLYPKTIRNQPSVVGTTELVLQGGQAVVLPPGVWLINPGKVSMVQIKDPVTTVWRPLNTSQAAKAIESDGVNFRVWNPTGFPVGAVVTNAGTGYTSAPTVAANIGGSTWSAVVGGGVSALNLTSGGGVGYTYPPLVNIAAPPAGGVPATALALVSGGVIRSFTMVDNGAGYGTSAPEVAIVPHPLDTGPTTAARATAQLSFVGQITAVLCTGQGTDPLNIHPTLAFTGGGGSNVTATAVMAYGISAITLVDGSGFGGLTRVGLTSVGGFLEAFSSGRTPAASAQNPTMSVDMFVPRKIDGTTSVGALGAASVGLASGIVDPGLFQVAPTIVTVPNGGTAPTATITCGPVDDIVIIQPLATQ